MINVTQIEGRVRKSAIKKVVEIVDNPPEETVAILRQCTFQEA